MRLLNIETYELEVFAECLSVEKYAILSHVWDRANGEFTYEQMQEIQGRSFLDASVLQYPGLEKIRNFCEIAKQANYKYVWIDTCCIDRRSGPELEEAIRSMFQWYREATECFVYLRDVESWDQEYKFRDSEWFRRGWTLQELIAPKKIRFYRNNWKFYGLLEHMRPLVTEITSIPSYLLECKDNIHRELAGISVAKKMSWAAKRETGRVEDKAYCLMGIFDVIMPIFYGEGDKSFYRLQKEILGNTGDTSIFAWRADVNTSARNMRGLFAMSPKEFENSGQFEQCDQVEPLKPSLVHQIHPSGLVFRKTLEVVEERDRDPDQPQEQWWLSLGCERKGVPACIRIIFLGKEGVAARINADSFFKVQNLSRQPADSLIYVVPFGKLEMNRRNEYPDFNRLRNISNHFKFGD